MSKSNLVNVFVPAYSGNYTIGRSGRKIEAITIHHMAGILSAEQCGNIFQQIGRGGSSHYGIGNDGRIGLYVDEENTAWTNSNWDSNCKSVTIEVSNNVYGGNWSVSDNALNSLIKLVADIAKRNNLGTLVKGVNVTWHRMFTATTCPGEYLLSKMDYIISEANKINSTSPVEPTTQDIKVGSKIKIGTIAPYKYYIADDVQIKYGIYQIRENVNAGGENAFEWRDNGIPEACVDLVDENGNKLPNSDYTHTKKGDKFIFAKTFEVKKIAYDNNKKYFYLDFDGNADNRFWVIEDYCYLV